MPECHSPLGANAGKTSPPSSAPSFFVVETSRYSACRTCVKQRLYAPRCTRLGRALARVSADGFLRRRPRATFSSREAFFIGGYDLKSERLRLFDHRQQGACVGRRATRPRRQGPARAPLFVPGSAAASRNRHPNAFRSNRHRPAAAWLPQALGIAETSCVSFARRHSKAIRYWCC